MTDTILYAKELKKSFVIKEETITAVKGVDLTVYKGEIFSLLGPNGAGKTTTLRMLTTLLALDGGEASIGGYDVSRQPDEVRKRIGLVSQVGGADDEATGFQDLLLQARLYGIALPAAKKRVSEVAEMLKLEDFIHRKISTYSGGQKRRLDVASGIIHKPDILFLDEPTTGLDPQNRANLWDQILKLRDNGTTIILVTHYLEEADVLSDRLAIIDGGAVIAEGSPRELKAKVAGDAILIIPKKPQDIEVAAHHLSKKPFIHKATAESNAVRLYVDNGPEVLPKVLSLLEAKNIAVETASLSRPSLDDVFLKETGRSLRDAGNNNTEEK